MSVELLPIHLCIFLVRNNDIFNYFKIVHLIILVTTLPTVKSNNVKITPIQYFIQTSKLFFNFSSPTGIRNIQTT